jgi:hypothetical protein
MKRTIDQVETEVDTPPDFEPESLCLATPHQLDADIKFTEDDHKYYVRFDDTADYVSDGITSVSTFIHEFFPHFDPDVVIAKMRKGRNWETGRYVGMSTEAIKKMWEDNGKAASSRGTLLHFLLECHNNGYDLTHSPYASILEVQDYGRWREKHFGGLVPFRTEMRMFTGPDLKITGTADLLAIDETHPLPADCNGVLSLHLIDWKFSKAINLTNRFESGFGVCHDLAACNFSAYALQQNMYQWMMETYYPDWTWKGHIYTSVRIISKHLAIFHTNHGREGYYLPLPDMQDRVKSMMEVRRAALYVPTVK